MRRWLAKRMRYAADRIDRRGAPKATHLSFTFEERHGLVINDRGIGCRLWYLNDDEYARAHSESAAQSGSRWFTGDGRVIDSDRPLEVWEMSGILAAHADTGTLHDGTSWRVRLVSL